MHVYLKIFLFIKNISDDNDNKCSSFINSVIKFAVVKETYCSIKEEFQHHLSIFNAIFEFFLITFTTFYYLQ